MRPPANPVIGIAAKPQSGGALPVLNDLLAWLQSRGVRCVLDPDAHRLAGDLSSLPVEERARLPQVCDLVVVLGGDGTLLSVARHMHVREVPILGVNLGSLGFLTEIAREEMLRALEGCLQGRAAIQRRMMLQATLVRAGGDVAQFHCLNDVVINKGALARIIELRVEVGGTWLTDMRADGLIVATPTGSTGYNLSAGGPILVPNLDCLVMSAVAPHTLTMRPLLVDGRAPIGVSLLRGGEQVYLTADGQLGHPLQDGDHVRIERSPHQVPLVVSSSRNYFTLLREKLGWGSR